MPAEEVAEIVLEVIEGGKSVSNVIHFVADNGDDIAQGVQSTAQAGNGIAATITSLVSGGVTAGLGMLAVDVGVAGLAIAPALGILAGVGLYELAPEFWTSVSDSLLEAGQTIGGKVHALLTDDGRVAYSQETIEIFKNAFISAGIFDVTVERTTTMFDGLHNYVPVSDITVDGMHYTELDLQCILLSIQGSNGRYAYTEDDVVALIAYMNTIDNGLLPTFMVNGRLACMYFNSSFIIFHGYSEIGNLYTTESTDTYGRRIRYLRATGHLVGKFRQYRIRYSTDSTPSGYTRLTPRLCVQRYEASDIDNENAGNDAIVGQQANGIFNDDYKYHYGMYGWPECYLYEYGVSVETLTTIGNPITSWTTNYFNIAISLLPTSLQPNAAYPKSSETIPTTYPNWIPITTPQELPTYYPVEMPYELPEQEQAQDPVPLTDPAEWVKWIIENLPIPDPDPDPYPEPGPAPAPDPDPQPDPEPAPEPDPEPAEPNPPDPNTPVQPDPDPVIPPILTPVSVNALFTVYNPSSSQLNSLGAYLWSSSILDQLVKIWQNPMDGIISLRQVYCTPTIGSSTNIILGTLDSSVPAPIVTSQFTTVDCGTITIDEKNHNVTDYSPYATVHLYLPFVGIVELDTDEVMNSTIGVKYTVDVYTGTCLAEVSITRSPDMTVTKILYTFSGNCSQEIPITSASHAGWMQALLGLAAGAATIASGGTLAAVGAAVAGEKAITSGVLHMGGSLAHEMVHIAHSGSLSSNAGIMGQRNPYAIIGRRKGYDANGYNDIYGYPANKTVFLVNCTGYVRVKAIDLQSAATEDEKQEILQWLQSGIYL